MREARVVRELEGLREEHRALHTALSQSSMQLNRVSETRAGLVRTLSQVRPSRGRRGWRGRGLLRRLLPHGLSRALLRAAVPACVVNMLQPLRLLLLRSIALSAR
jgi:hypothetical protein